MITFKIFLAYKTYCKLRGVRLTWAGLKKYQEYLWQCERNGWQPTDRGYAAFILTDPYRQIWAR